MMKYLTKGREERKEGSVLAHSLACSGAMVVGAFVHGLFGSVIRKQRDMNNSASLTFLLSIWSRTPADGMGLPIFRRNFLINSVNKI